jgi:transcriptional regulator with XRE-family HTH domain
VSKVVTGIRKAIADSGETRYAISKGSGVSQSQLSNFCRGLASLSIENLERVADYLGLEIILRRRRRRKA